MSRARPATRVRARSNIYERRVRECRFDQGLEPYRWINIVATKVRNMDLKSTSCVFGQPNFVRRGTALHGHAVALRHEGDDSSGSGEDFGPVECDAGCIDIEPSKDLGGRVIEAQNNLDWPIRVLTMNGQRVLGADSRDFPRHGVPDCGVDCGTFCFRLSRSKSTITS